MGNNVWIIVGVIVIVALGAWYFMSGDGTAPPATEPAATEAPAADAPAADAPATGTEGTTGGTTGN